MSTTSGRHRCACRAVLLPPGDAPVLEQVGVEPAGPRMHEHGRQACARHGVGREAASGSVSAPGAAPGPQDPALEQLRELAERIRRRAEAARGGPGPELLPVPVATEPPPRPWQDLDDDEEGTP